VQYLGSSDLSSQSFSPSQYLSCATQYPLVPHRNSDGRQRTGSLLLSADIGPVVDELDDDDDDEEDEDSGDVAPE